MNYQKHYDLLIERARARVLSGYVEVHHVVPRCIGGSDEKGNLVQLTAEEHYVAHQLLHKIYPHVKGLMFALRAMAGGNGNRQCNKSYGWVRRKCAEISSIQTKELWKNPEYREAVSSAISVLHKGRVKSAEERANISEAGRNRKPRVFSEQARLNMAEARRKTWQERRDNGTAGEIAAKTRATRIANGSYRHTDASKAALSKSGKGRIPWNKGLKFK